MAWGLEARVPFLDKAFLDVAMDIKPTEKMFSKGSSQQTDADGCPKMEKVSHIIIYWTFFDRLLPQYILRKAFDHSRDGKVSGGKTPSSALLTFLDFSAISSPLNSLASERTVF